MNKSFAVLVTAVGMLSSACATRNSAPQAPEAPRDAAVQVELRCTPRIAMGSMFGPVTVMAFLSVKNPGEKFWCPAVEWSMGDTKLSGHESDCDPYATVVAEQGKAPEVWSEPVKYFALSGGEHTITAKLLMSGNLIASKSCQVTVR